MKKVLMFSLLLVSVLFCACSSSSSEEPINEDYLEIEEGLFFRQWWLSGEINGKILDSAMLSEKQIKFWQEEKDTLLTTYPMVVYHHQKGETIRPGQLTYGGSTDFIIENIDHEKRSVTFRKVEYHHLTSTAIIRFLPGDNDDSYILHVNYDGTDYEVEGYLR